MHVSAEEEVKVEVIGDIGGGELKIAKGDEGKIYCHTTGQLDAGLKNPFAISKTLAFFISL